MLKVLDHVAVVARTFEDADAVLAGSLGLTLDKERSNWPNGVNFESEQTRFYFFDVAGSETQIEVLVPDPGSRVAPRASSSAAVPRSTTSASASMTCTRRPNASAPPALGRSSSRVRRTAAAT